jgi:hypothetical protein
MALIKGTNSYVEVAEAELYFANKPDVAAWTEASDTLKAQSLVTATSILDELNWIGTAVSEDQPLAFPRVGSYWDPRLGITKSFDDVDSPTRVLNATYELAYHVLNNDGLMDSTGGVIDIEVGSIKLKNIIPVSLIPASVRRIINPMLRTGGRNAVWRAN